MRTKNYLLAGVYFLCASVTVGALTSCGDDDDEVVAEVHKEKASLNAVVDESSIGETTATVSWSGFETGAVYTYQLAAEGVEVITSTTSDLSLSFDDLKPGTAYTLYVQAENADKLAYSLVSFTTAAQQLHATYDNVYFNPDYVVLYWDEIEGASSYSYTVTDAAGNVLRASSTQYTSVILHGLDAATTYSATVTTEDGSVTSTFDFTTPAVKAKLDGMYSRWKSINGSSYWYPSKPTSTVTKTIVVYDNNTYSLLAWYGAEGYNLNYLYKDGVATILSDYGESGGWYYVDSGVDGVYPYLYPDSFTADDDKIDFGYYIGYDFYEFTYPAE